MSLWKSHGVARTIDRPSGTVYLSNSNGDPKVFGIAYVGDGGRGIAVGKPTN
jgi:hypothetical protein